MSAPLPRSFYDRPVIEVARRLLGQRLLRRSREGLAGGRIVEVEAYLSGNDPANHAFRGQTRKNTAMFGPPGHAYVYPIHARWCLNAVTEPPGVPSAVLIRAVEPLVGLDLMHHRRRSDDPRLLASGPARLCEALAIDRRLNEWDLARGERLWIEAPDDPADLADLIVTTQRIGVTSGHDLPLRFLLTGNRFVSRPPRKQSSDAAV